MNKLLNMISGIFGAIGSIIAGLFGGWSTGISVLCLFIVLDFVTGIIGAALCKSNKSEKSETGGINSKVIWIGILKKILELMMVVVCHQFDLLLGANYIRDAVVIAYIITETVSIIENAGLIGLPIPPIITKVIDVLKNKNDNINVE